MLVETTEEARLVTKISRSKRVASDMARDVLVGLSAQPKWLPSMYLYDEKGSELFEQICRLPEYYITRTEHAILEQYGPEIVACSNGGMALVELGSGSSLKTRLLIEALLDSQGYLHYFPIDISETILLESSQRLLEDYAGLHITAHVAEYNEGIHRIAAEEFEQKMVIFLGSNIGNFDKDAALQFLRKIRRELNADDHLLLGVDMQKDPAILEAAYDDAQGVTAEFNLNLLRRINRELNGDFDLEAYSHLAVYNSGESRMEMHLRSEKAQQAFIGRLERSFGFEQGETIHTENSHKYSPDQLARICQQSGFRVVQRWQDDNEYFSLVLLAPV